MISCDQIANQLLKKIRALCYASCVFVKQLFLDIATYVNDNTARSVRVGMLIVLSCVIVEQSVEINEKVKRFKVYRLQAKN